MKRKSRGQTLVEFAMVFPLIMTFLFATIDFGYWIYAWSQIQYSARRGAEQASRMQPREVKTADFYRTNTAYQNSDPCLGTIFSSTKGNGSLTALTAIENKDIYLSFYQNGADITPRTDVKASTIGKVVEVRVDKELYPLTPLTSTFVSKYLFTSVSRRTIVSKDPGYAYVDGTGANYNTCTK